MRPPHNDRPISPRGLRRFAPPCALAVFFLATAALLVPQTALASPPDVFGYGARSQGMGMTGTAFADTYEAVYSNPAGLSRATRTGFNLGLQLGHFSLDVDGANSPLDAYGGLTIGMQIPLPFGGVLEDTFVIGAGFFAPNGAVLQTDIIFPEIPSWVLLNRSQSVHLQMGLGINLNRLVPGLRLGVGFAALANIGGRLNVIVDEAAQFVSETETQLLASYSPIVGAQYDIGPVSIGFTWHDEVISEIDLNIVTGLPLELPVITITATPQYDPHLFSLEVAYRPIEDLLIAANFDMRLWSRYNGVVGKSTANSNTPPDPGFRNTYSPSLGLEYTLHHGRTDTWLRTGYSFEMTPAPPAALRNSRDADGNNIISGGSPVLQPVRYLDSNRHVISLGAGVQWHSEGGAYIRLDAFSQFHILESRTHDIPSTGNAQEIMMGGGNPMTSGGWLVAGGLNVSLEW